MKKILIACTFIVAIGSFNNTATYAQSADVIKVERVTNDSFLKLVKQYQKAEDKQVARKYMEQITTSMRSSIANSKIAFENPDENTDAKIKQYENQTELYNKIIEISKNETLKKEEVMRILKDFSTTL